MKHTHHTLHPFHPSSPQGRFRHQPRSRFARVAAVATFLLGFGLSQATRAEEREMGPYFNFDGGPSWAQSVHAVSGGISGTADLDVGVRFGMAFGYNFHRNVGVEFETGWLWNDFRDSAYSLTQVPLLVNAVFRYPNRTGIEPYIGGGLGGLVSNFGVNDCCGDTDTDFVFAWQGMAGVRYQFNPNMALGLGYKYLGVSETDFSVYGIHTRLDTLHNHSVGIVFNMKF